MAIKAGIPADKATNVEGNLVNVLGSASPHPIDMASAYGTIANQGKRVKWAAVSEIRRWDGNEVMWKHDPKPDQVFKKDVMADTTFAMQGVVQNGSGSAARALGRPVAGKTGTSSDSRSAWFIGFTPDMVTAVAMYQNDAKGNPVEMQGFGGRSTITGGGFPAQIWTEYMKSALDNRPVLEFPDPEWVGEVENPAPIVTRDDDDDDDEGDRPTERPDPTDTEKPDPGDNPRPTKPVPSFTLPTVGPTNGNGNGRGGGGGG
jgi:membrane peptidoglycan carboxypeptidase